MTETPSVTRYEREEKRVTNAESNAAPHHTTPHHTTKNDFQRDHGTTREVGKWTTTQREVTPLDALAAAVCLIRPDWNHTTVRSTLLRTHGSWREIATRALRVALDDDARTPFAIENGDMRRYEKSDAERHPSAVTYAERKAELARITEEGA